MTSTLPLCVIASMAWLAVSEVGTLTRFFLSVAAIVLAKNIR